MLDDLLLNPVISELGKNPYWTVSTTKGKEKKCPLNFSNITRGIIRGARPGDSSATTTLDKVLSFRFDDPDHSRFTNASYFIDTLRDNYLILDIEQTCPEDKKQELLKIPCAYAETSASGKGIHMLVYLPQEARDTFPILEKKTVIKAPDKSYEFLLSHWVMFTGNQIDYISGKPTNNDLKPLYDLCSHIEETESLYAFEMDSQYSVTLDEEWQQLRLEDVEKSMAYWYEEHTVKEYDNDWSRFTFAFMVRAIKAIQLCDAQLSRLLPEEHTPADDKELVRIIYQITTDIFPHREKHDEMRCGVPFLVYRAVTAVEYALPENLE